MSYSQDCSQQVSHDAYIRYGFFGVQTIEETDKQQQRYAVMIHVARIQVVSTCIHPCRRLHVGVL